MTTGQLYVRTDSTQWPVQWIEEYVTRGGRTHARVVVAGYSGICQYRTFTVPLDDLLVRS